MPDRRRLKIVHVVVTDQFAGVERSVVLSCRALANLGHDVTVIGGDASTMAFHLQGSSVDWLPARNVSQAVRRLSSLGRQDVVHAHMTKAEVAVVLARRVNRGEFFLTRHFAQHRGLGRGGALARQLVQRATRHEISISRFVADAIECPSTVIYHGIETFGATAAVEKRVVVIQRLEEEKDTQLALRAWRLSRLAEDGWTLALAGDGGERPALEALARTLHIQDSVEFLGRVKDVDSVRARASIQLAPPTGEHFGLSVLEAMACGLPLVLSRSGAHPELVGEPECGFFEPRSPEDAALVLRRVASDAGLRARLASYLRLRQQVEFSIDRHVASLVDLYTTAVTDGRA